jgi:trehalose-6-phosphate synthase
MFNIGTTSDYVKSVYELVMLVIIVTKGKRLILSKGEGSRSGLLAILIVNQWNSSELIE